LGSKRLRGFLKGGRVGISFHEKVAF